MQWISWYTFKVPKYPEPSGNAIAVSSRLKAFTSPRESRIFISSGRRNQLNEVLNMCFKVMHLLLRRPFQASSSSGRGSPVKAVPRLSPECHAVTSHFKASTAGARNPYVLVHRLYLSLKAHDELLLVTNVGRCSLMFQATSKDIVIKYREKIME